jgi:hypothetical protein
MIVLYSAIHGVNVSTAMRIAKVESNMIPTAKSRTDGGLFQLNKKSFKFHNEDWRYDIVVNTNSALHYLHTLQNKCKHRIDNTHLVCYNLGVNGAKRIKNPKNQNYYKKITQLLRR